MYCATSTPAKRRRLSPPRRLDTSVDIHEYLSDISSGSENKYNSEHEERDIIPIEEVDPISSASDESDAEEEEEGGDESVGVRGRRGVGVRGRGRGRGRRRLFSPVFR